MISDQNVYYQLDESTDNSEGDKKNVVVNENVLVGSRLVERFQSVQLRSVVVSMELAKVTMFVSKQASLAVWTHYFSIEGAAIF